MEILEAYCVELGRTVNIYEAHKAYFDFPPARQKRFNFKCSDEACRKQKDPLISGVNYDKLVEEKEKYRQIHFRAPKGNPHLDTCEWVLGEEKRQSVNVEGSTETPFGSRVERAKSTNVIDVFRPKNNDPLIESVSSGKSVKLDSKSQGATNGSSDSGARARDGYTVTSLLERFIDCWAQYEGDELKEHQVTIAGRTLSYRQAVLLPAWITPEENGTRIIAGNARASLWPAENPKHLYINFMDECTKFSEHQGKKSLVLDLSLSRIRSCSGSTLFLKKIEQSLKTGFYLKVYCWGQIVSREGKAGFSVELSSLDNLVLKVIESKRRAASRDTVM